MTAKGRATATRRTDSTANNQEAHDDSDNIDRRSFEALANSEIIRHGAP
jgi:hypothetical protein